MFWGATWARKSPTALPLLTALRKPFIQAVSGLPLKPSPCEMHWLLFPGTPTPPPQANSKREFSRGWGCSNTSLYLEHPAAFSTQPVTPESGPRGALPPPPFPSCDPLGFPQQPLRISVILLYYLQGVFPEAANALPGRLPVLFKCLNPANLHKIGAGQVLIYSWGIPGNPVRSRLSNVHFVNSSF